MINNYPEEFHQATTATTLKGREEGGFVATTDADGGAERGFLRKKKRQRSGMRNNGKCATLGNEEIDAEMTELDDDDETMDISTVLKEIEEGRMIKG